MIGHAAFEIFDDTGAWRRFDLTGGQVLKLVPRLLAIRR